MIIDAHQHFWQLSRGDYGWLTPDLTPLYRDFLPIDLGPAMARNAVQGTILVQAAPTEAETHFLLKLADETHFIKGVVGWVDLEAKTAPSAIERLAQHPKLVGLRPMVQDILDDDWILRDSLSPAFEAMSKHSLTLDALILPKHLPRLQRLTALYPNLNVVIDHGAKPDIAAGAFSTWAENMNVLARNSNVFCKLSGLVTEAGTDWRAQDIEPYAQHLFHVFGTQRIIWGSDWPVLSLAGDYDDWFALAKSYCTSSQDFAKVFGHNALTAYGLGAE